MKLALLITTAAGVCALAAPAYAQTTGHVGVSATHAEIDSSGLSADDDSFAIDGAVAIPTSENYALILDGAYIDGDDSDGTLQGTAHFLRRNEDHAFGGFLGLIDNDSDTAWTGGLEFAKFFSSSTLVLAGGYGEADDVDANLYGIGAEYRIFSSDNLRFDVRGGWQKIDAGGGDADGVNLGAGVEWKFASSPVSLFGAVDYSTFNDVDTDVTAVSVGIKFDFGSDTLKHRDRKGATFNPLGGLGSGFGLF